MLSTIRYNSKINYIIYYSIQGVVSGVLLYENERLVGQKSENVLIQNIFHIQSHSFPIFSKIDGYHSKKNLFLHFKPFIKPIFDFLITFKALIRKNIPYCREGAKSGEPYVAIGVTFSNHELPTDL